MRFAHLAALVALTSFSAQLTFAQSLLSQVEQGLAPGGGQANGYLGAELDDEGQMNKGVLVTAIRPGTAAEKGGLKAGDLITHVDGKPVPNLDAYDAVAKRPPNTLITMTIVRDGRSQALPVTLGTKTVASGSNPADVTPPPTTVAPASPSAPGLAPPSLTPPGPAPSGAAPSLFPPTGAASPSPAEPAPRSSGIIATPQTTVPPAVETPAASSGAGTSGKASLGVRLPPPNSGAPRAQRGALIELVNPGSPAEQAGLKAGQLIVGLDGKRIESDDELIAAIKARQPGQSVEIRYRDGDAGSDVRTTTVRLAQSGAPAGAAGPAATPGSGFAPRTGGAFSPPPGSGSGTGSSIAPGTRLMDRIERIADNLAPRPLSTVYDPQAFAALQTRVDQLEARVKALENKAGITPSGSGAPAGSPGAPGFGSPTPPSTTPGFGSPSGTSP